MRERNKYERENESCAGNRLLLPEIPKALLDSNSDKWYATVGEQQQRCQTTNML